MDIDNSACRTRQNSDLCSKESTFAGAVQLQFLKLGIAIARRVGKSLPLVQAEAQGYRGCNNGAYDSTLKIDRSDQVLHRIPTIFALLIIQSKKQCYSTEEGLLSLLHETGFHPSILSAK